MPPASLIAAAAVLIALEAGRGGGGTGGGYAAELLPLSLCPYCCPLSISVSCHAASLI